MPDQGKPDTQPDLDRADRAGRVVAWLNARDEMERALEEALGDVPSARHETLARMAEVLQATAHGLGPEAAAVWAGIPNRVLQNWLAADPAFASALRSAAALASQHGLEPGGTPTPAMIRVATVALSRGATWVEALAVSGFAQRRFRRLTKDSPALAALLEAARRARPRISKVFVPATYRPRRPGQKRHSERAFRLVQRGTPSTSPVEPQPD
ncbi:hypothetical protein [Streptomyces virginiae]|uniref:hypothetical protein n=1 Tax=Streptomyces virginiae TaxID=1961 RepID=UPI0036FFA565